MSRVENAIKGILSNWFNAADGDFQGTAEIHEAKLTQSKMISFDLRFREMVELMNEAQRFGTTNGMEAKYVALRTQLRFSYQEIRLFLLAYLRFDLEDERLGIRTIGRGTDAFQALWVHETLRDFVDADDVFFRDRVARAKEAVRDYTEHLHCLLETRV